MITETGMRIFRATVDRLEPGTIFPWRSVGRRTSPLYRSEAEAASWARRLAGGQTYISVTEYFLEAGQLEFCSSYRLF